MYKKNIFSLLSVLLEGGDEIRSLSMQFCDEILPPQTVTFFWTLNDDGQELPA